MLALLQGKQTGREEGSLPQLPDGAVPSTTRCSPWTEAGKSLVLPVNVAGKGKVVSSPSMESPGDRGPDCSSGSHLQQHRGGVKCCHSGLVAFCIQFALMEMKVQGHRESDAARDEGSKNVEFNRSAAVSVSGGHSVTLPESHPPQMLGGI